MKSLYPKIKGIRKMHERNIKNTLALIYQAIDEGDDEKISSSTITKEARKIL